MVLRALPLEHQFATKQFKSVGLNLSTSELAVYVFPLVALIEKTRYFSV